MDTRMITQIYVLSVFSNTVTMELGYVCKFDFQIKHTDVPNILATFVTVIITYFIEFWKTNQNVTLISFHWPNGLC